MRIIALSIFLFYLISSGVGAKESGRDLCEKYCCDNSTSQAPAHETLWSRADDATRVRPLPERISKLDFDKPLNVSKFAGSLSRAAIPPKLDYRDSNLVSPVKDQGYCGSSWAFATTAYIESILLRKARFQSLSEQELVDCTFSNPRSSCTGGYIEAAIEHIQAYGLGLSSAYPYQGCTGHCPEILDQVGRVRFNKLKYFFGTLDDKLVQRLLLSKGPLMMPIYADDSLNEIGSQIYHPESCTKKPRNHAVLLVGYGTDEETGAEYWLAKNSWGTEFGVGGYFRMARGKSSCNSTSPIFVIDLAL